MGGLGGHFGAPQVNQIVKLCWKTMAPPWTTVIVAWVKVTSVISAVQFEFGHPASCAVGCDGGAVVTLNDTLPFLICDAGIFCDPVVVTSPGF